MQQRRPALDGVPRYRIELLHNVLWLMTVASAGKYTTRYRTEDAGSDPHAALRHEHVAMASGLFSSLVSGLAAFGGQSADLASRYRTS